MCSVLLFLLRAVLCCLLLLVVVLCVCVCVWRCAVLLLSLLLSLLLCSVAFDWSLLDTIAYFCVLLLCVVVAVLV